MLYSAAAFQDKVGSWYSNPGTGTDTQAVGGGVGKYLKARNPQADSNSLPPVPSSKKRKVGTSTEFKNFSGW